MQLLSTSESFSDEESSNDKESPSVETSPAGQEDEEPCDEQIISEGK